MRIRWNKHDIDEVTTISFTPTWKPGADVFTDLPNEIYLGGLDFRSDEWNYWGEVIMDAFDSPKAALAWVDERMETVMKEGYLDLADCPYIEIY